MSEVGRELLARAEEFLQAEVAELANQMDSDPALLQEKFSRMSQLGLLSMRRPMEYGGPAIDEISFRHFQELVARYSGSLAFLQTQHQSAVKMVANSENEQLKQKVLLKAGQSRFYGIGFSQLRRAGDPLLKAEDQGEHYLLYGKVPWVTGHGFFHDFVIGAALPDGSAVFGIVPFVDSLVDGGSIIFEGPMKLAAMESPRTMSASLQDFPLDKSSVLFIKEPNWILENDMINVTLQAWFALGCARAGLDIVQEAFERRKSDFIHASWIELDRELGECRQAASDQQRPLEDRLRARAWAIDLAARCSHAGVVVSSGAANSVHHKAQRVYREAMVYTVSAQTGEIMQATLDRLVRRGGPT